jgi:RNA polymerase sigma-70 factor (ECF subfamily)
MVYGLCRVLLRDADDAEDAAQQVFLSAHRSLLGGTEPREPVAWLGAIARNECRARIRQRMRTPLALVDERAAAAADVEHVAGQRAEIEALCAALAELPQQQREALVLREFYGLSYDEVRAALGVTDAAVESLLFRARKRLQFELRPARVASGALALPLALRDSLAGAVPGFASPSSGGVLAKLASLPVAAKLAAAAATLTAAGTIGFVEVKSGHREPLTQPSRAPARERARVGGTESDSPLELARAAVAPQPVKGSAHRHERGAADDDEQVEAAEDQPAAVEEREDDEVGAVEPAETEGEQGDADDGDEPANSTAGDDSNEDDGDE